MSHQATGSDGIEARKFAKQLRFSDEPKNSTESIWKENGPDEANELKPQQQEANTNELLKHEGSQTPISKQAETSETTLNEAGDESKEANKKSLTFEEMPKEDQKEPDAAKEVANSKDDLEEDELDLLDAAMWPLSNSIDRRAFLLGDHAVAKNGTTSRLASLIAHKPFGLRNLAWNSTVLRALERRRLKQRERLRRMRQLQNTNSDRGIRTRGGNKKRDLNDQAQTRQGFTTSTTLGPDPTLLAGSAGKSQLGANSYLKAGAFKHLPSLGSSSNQLSSAFQRLISGKLGLTSGSGPQTAFNGNQDLTLANNNLTLASDFNGRKNLFNLDLDSNQMLELSPDQLEDDQADFSSTSASGHHQSLAPSKSTIHGGVGGFDGAQHEFDLPPGAPDSFEHESQETGDGDQLVEQLVNQANQQQQWAQQESANDVGGLQTLQAAQRLNRLKSLAAKPGRGKEVSLVRANSNGAGSKQLIPVEIIGLDPSVTNSILFGASINQAGLGSAQPQTRPNEVQNEQVSDELANGNRLTQQVASSSEFVAQDNPTASNSSSLFAGSQQQAEKQDHPNIEFHQAEAVGQLENPAQANHKLSNPSSVLHVHHFHHTNPDHVTKVQEIEGGERASDSSQAQGEQTSGSGDTPGPVLTKPEFMAQLQANLSSHQNESVVEVPNAADQSAQEEGKAEAKQVRFVTRNSSAPVGAQADDTAKKHQVSLDATSNSQLDQVPSSRFTTMQPGGGINLVGLQNGLEVSGGAAPNANGMLMVAYKPAGRARTQSVNNQQSSDQFQPNSFGQSNLWSAANFMNGLSRGNQTHDGESNMQANYITQPMRSPFNEGSESSHMLLNSAQDVRQQQQQQQQQRQRLIDAALATTNSIQRQVSPPGNLNYQQHLTNVLSKPQHPKINPALLAQLQEKLNGESVSPADTSNWTSEDERLLAQLSGPTGRPNNHNLYLNYTTQQNNQLKQDGRNPFQNHYQNMVGNLVLLKQMRQRNEEAQVQSLLSGNGQLQGTLFGAGKEPVVGASRPAMSTSSSQQHLATRPNQNEIAAILQEHLSRQLQNRTLASDQLLLNATSGRYELTMASDRAPAKLLRDHQQQAQAVHTSSNSSPRPIVQQSHQQTFSANENFHVPNTSSQNGDNKLVVAPVINKSSPAEQTPNRMTGINQNQNVELETTRNVSIGSKPSIRNNESFMDSTESVNNFALAFIFVVSLLTFILIAASLIYRKRRTAIGGGSTTRRNVDLSSSSSPTGFSIAQRTRHLMRSNVFAGVTRSRPQQQAAEAAISMPNRASNSSSVSSSAASLGSMAHVVDVTLSGEAEPKVGQKILNLRHSHQSDGLASRSAWAKHLRPVLRRAPTLQQASVCTKQAAEPQQLARDGGHNYNMNKYVVGKGRNSTSNTSNNSNINNNSNNNIGATFDLSQRRSQAAVATRAVGQEKYRTATNETTTNATTTTTNSSTNDDDDSLASNPDSDIRTLNTRLHKVAPAYAHSQLDLALGPVSPQAKSSSDPASHHKKRPPSNRLAAH